MSHKLLPQHHCHKIPFIDVVLGQVWLNFVDYRVNRNVGIVHPLVSRRYTEIKTEELKGERRPKKTFPGGEPRLQSQQVRADSEDAAAIWSRQPKLPRRPLLYLWAGLLV